MHVIREERVGDAAAIYAVHTASFPMPAEAQLVDLLRSGGKLSVSLVAEGDGQIVGHVAFSPVTTTLGKPGLGLGPVAVLPAYRKRGIAAELIRAGLDACRTLGSGWVVVLGDPNYYGRFGFQPARTFGLSDEFRGGDAFQAIELLPGTIPRSAGLVRYAPQFAMLE